MGRKCVGARSFKSQRVPSDGVYIRYVLYSSVDDHHSKLPTHTAEMKASARRFRSKSWSDYFAKYGKVAAVRMRRVDGTKTFKTPARSYLIHIMSANLQPRPWFRFHGILEPQKRRGFPQRRSKTIVRRQRPLGHDPSFLSPPISPPPPPFYSLLFPEPSDSPSCSSASVFLRRDTYPA